MELVRNPSSDRFRLNCPNWIISCSTRSLIVRIASIRIATGSGERAWSLYAKLPYEGIHELKIKAKVSANEF